MSNEYPYASMRDSFDLSAYFVVGPEDCKGRPLTDVVDQALHGGATFIQLRAKEADASELTDMARDIAQIIEDNDIPAKRLKTTSAPNWQSAPMNRWSCRCL